MPSYTARELERDTGFDRRTIAYYVQEGLLPKVGRRGPRTRYPKLVRDRLLFIRRVREAEEEGEVPAVSLSDMKKVFERVPPALIAGVADGRIAVSSGAGGGAVDGVSGSGDEAEGAGGAVGWGGDGEADRADEGAGAAGPGAASACGHGRCGGAGGR